MIVKVKKENRDMQACLIVNCIHCLTPLLFAAGVRIKLRGKGHVSWSEGSGDSRRHYSATEDYIDTVIILFGNGTLYLN